MGCDEQIGDYSMSEIGSVPVSIEEMEAVLVMYGVSKSDIEWYKQCASPTAYEKILQTKLREITNGNHT